MRNLNQINLTITVFFKSRYQAGQFVKPNSNIFDFSSVLFNNLCLLTMVVLGYLLVVAITTALPVLVHANCSHLKSLKLVLVRALFMDTQELPSASLRLVFLFFGLFLFFNLNFLSGTVKTDKVTIETDDIIDSSDKLAGTTKTLATGWLGAALMKTAPEGSFLKKLSKKKILLVDGVVELEKVKSRGIDCCVFFANRIPLAYVMSLLSLHANDIGSIAFAKPTGHYELLTTLYMRRNLDEERKRFINSR